MPVFIGLISYSWYLWHWPLIVLMKYTYGETLSHELMAIAVVASALLALLSWRFVETPFRKKTWLPRTKPLLLSVVGTSATIFMMAGVIDLQEGMPERLTGRAQQLFQSQQQPHYYDGNPEYDKIQKDQVPIRGDRNGDYTIMVWGDSHGMAIMPAVDEICREKNIKCYQLTYPHSAPLLLDEWFDESAKYDYVSHNQACFDFAVRNQVDQIVMIGYWMRYDREMLFGKHEVSLESALQTTLQEVTSLGIPVVLLEDYPIYEKHIETIMLRSAWKDEDLSGYGMELQRHRKRSLRQHRVFQSLNFPNLTVHDPTTCFLDEQGFLPLQKNDLSFYCDADHLSEYGANKLIPLVNQIIETPNPRTAEQRTLERQ